jgi:hypothetical protein
LVELISVEEYTVFRVASEGQLVALEPSTIVVPDTQNVPKGLFITTVFAVNAEF